MRSRNTLLQSLCLVRALDARVSVNEMIAFLYAAENEGLTVQELAQVAGFTQSTASRSLRALGPKDSPWSQAPALGLLQAYLNPHDGRSHVIQLTERGREVRDRLDAIIGQSVTIAGARTWRAAWGGSAFQGERRQAPPPPSDFVSARDATPPRSP
jgi:DNA-binding MarR family transcriptional regulator